MIFLLHILVGAVAAFILALAVGPVNLAIIQGALDRGRNYALRVAVGSAVAEILYCLTAVGGVSVLFHNETAQETAVEILHVGSVPLLFGMGVANLLKKHTPDDAPPVRSKFEAQGAYLLGFMLNIANVALLIMWVSITAMLRKYGLISDEFGDMVGYSLGVGAGTFAMQGGIAVISARRVFTMNRYRRKLLSRIIGAGFIAAGAYQLVGVLREYVFV